jgi:hypothetical protein
MLDKIDKSIERLDQGPIRICLLTKLTKKRALCRNQFYRSFYELKITGTRF